MPSGETPSASPGSASYGPDRPELQAAIRQATDYLLRHLDAEGIFTYEAHLDPARSQAPRYNLLRHAGAMYALLQAYEHGGGRETLTAAIRASGYLRTFLGPVPEAPGRIALWSPVDWGLPASPSTIKAKLGGAGLALVGLARLHAAAPDAVRMEDLRGLARFIRSLQRPDGSFVSIYWPLRGADGTWSSLYYPGEAMLGLLMLERIEPDPDRLAAVRLGLLHLARTRADLAVADLPPDHWVMIATAEFLRQTAETLPAEERDELLRHAARLAERMLSEQLRSSLLPELDGALTPDARTTPTATRLEGLLAMLPLFRIHAPPLAERIDSAGARAIRFLVASRIREGPLAGGLPRRAAAGAAETARSGRGALVRVDYVQHALSAFLRYDAVAAHAPDAAGRASGRSR
jgi:hypothetical protein